MDFYYDKHYEEDLFNYFNEQLPEKLYDAHFHLKSGYPERFGYTDPYLQYADFTEKALGRKMAGGLVMANAPRPPRLEAANELVLTIAEERDLSVGYVITPLDNKEKIAAVLDANPRITALKPYFTYSDVPDIYEANISDYVPEWAFELANERHLPIIIHLSHYQDMLWDENNLREIRYFSEKYPNAKIVLAHCALGHNVRKLRLGLSEIADLKNIWFDCSGVSETMSIYYCLKTFGVEKMMWGGDHNYGQMSGRIVSFGSNFLALHPSTLKDGDLPLPADYKYQPLPNVIECTLALLEAMELLELSQKEREDIFYNNAAALYGRK